MVVECISLTRKIIVVKNMNRKTLMSADTDCNDSTCKVLETKARIKETIANFKIFSFTLNLNNVIVKMKNDRNSIVDAKINFANNMKCPQKSIMIV